MSNWVMGTCMTWVVKLFPSLNINGVFFLFAVTCTGAGVFVYFFCPETRGMLLEDIEDLFHANGSSNKKKDVETPQYAVAESPAMV